MLTFGHLLKHTSYMLRVNADGFRGDIYTADDSVSISSDGLANDATEVDELYVTP